MRERSSITFIGAQGSGKTEQAGIIAAQCAGFGDGIFRDSIFWIDHKLPRAEFRTLPQVPFEQISNTFFKTNKKTIYLGIYPDLFMDDGEFRDPFYEKLCSLRNLVIVLDDWGDVETGRIHRGYKSLNRLVRQRGLDCISIYHGFSDCPPGVYGLMNKIYLLQTADEPRSAGVKLPRMELMEAAHRKLLNSPKYSVEVVKILT